MTAALAGLSSEVEAKARVGGLAGRAEAIEDRLLTNNPVEAVLLKRELREAGVEVAVFQDRVVASLAWRGGTVKTMVWPLWSQRVLLLHLV